MRLSWYLSCLLWFCKLYENTNSVCRLKNPNTFHRYSDVTSKQKQQHEWNWIRMVVWLVKFTIRIAIYLRPYQINSRHILTWGCCHIKQRKLFHIFDYFSLFFFIIFNLIYCFNGIAHHFLVFGWKCWLSAGLFCFFFKYFSLGIEFNLFTAY